MRWVAVVLAAVVSSGCKPAPREQWSPREQPRFGPATELAWFGEELGHGITTDEDAVYLTASMGETGFVFRVDKKGGKRLLAREPQQAVAVRTHGDNVYYTVSNALRRVPKRGGEPSTVVEIGGGAWSMAAHGNALWLMDAGALTRISLPDGNKQRICDTPHGRGVLVDEGTVLWETYYSGNPHVWRLTSDGKCTFVFDGSGAMRLGRSGAGTLLAYEPRAHLHTYFDHDLYLFPDDNSEPRRLAHLGFTQERAVHGDSIYLARTTRDFRAPDNGWEIIRVDKATGAVTVLAAKMTTSVEDLVGDASGVYWVGKALDRDGWRLVKLPRLP